MKDAELRNENPQNINLLYGLGVSYAKLGEIYEKLENLELSKQNYGNALPIYEKLKEIYKSDKYNWHINFLREK